MKVVFREKWDFFEGKGCLDVCFSDVVFRIDVEAKDPFEYNRLVSKMVKRFKSLHENTLKLMLIATNVKRYKLGESASFKKTVAV